MRLLRLLARIAVLSIGLGEGVVAFIHHGQRAQLDIMTLLLCAIYLLADEIKGSLDESAKLSGANRVPDEEGER